MSVAVAFAVAISKMTAAEAMQYIDKTKCDYDSTWNNLVNFRIRHLVNGLTTESIC